MPELVMFQNTSYGISATGNSTSNIVPVMAMQGQTQGMVFYNPASGPGGNTYINWGDNTMSWYNVEGQYYQLNVSGETYYYLVFGR